jgi:hypothetical protein
VLRSPQLADAALVNKASPPDHHHMVADLLDLGNQVTRDKDRDPVLDE